MLRVAYHQNLKHKIRIKINKQTNKQANKHVARRTIRDAYNVATVASVADASVLNKRIHIFWTLALKRIAFVSTEIRTPFNTKSSVRTINDVYANTYITLYEAHCAFVWKIILYTMCSRFRSLSFSQNLVSHCYYYCLCTIADLVRRSILFFLFSRSFINACSRKFVHFFSFTCLLSLSLFRKYWWSCKLSVSSSLCMVCNANQK